MSLFNYTICDDFTLSGINLADPVQFLLAMDNWIIISFEH